MLEKKKRSVMSSLSFHLKDLEKEDQIKPKASRRKNNKEQISMNLKAKLMAKTNEVKTGSLKIPKKLLNLQPN